MDSPDIKEKEYYKSMYYQNLEDVAKYEMEVNQKITLLQTKVAEQGVRIGSLLNQLDTKSV